MTRHLLVVCTANVCRSPVVERLLTSAFSLTTDVDGEHWVASSAGTTEYLGGLDRNTVAAAVDAGLDVSTHRPRTLDDHILAVDGADLVLTLQRSHLPTVVGIDPSAWPRTFTLKELARRAAVLDPPSPDEGFVEWRQRMAEGRSTAEMIKPDPADDIADPYGLPRRHHDAMVAEVRGEIERLLCYGPWRSSNERAESISGSPRRSQ